MRVGTVESRESSRYAAVRSAVYLGWWEGEGSEFRTCAARLRNLSNGGALVGVAILPREGAELWLCLVGSPPGEWIGVSVVATECSREGQYQLRLRFPESCPFELFESAVLGHEPAGAG